MTANDRDAARGATESDVHAPGVLGDAPPVSGARLARYAEVIRKNLAIPAEVGRWANVLAEVVVAVADAEQAELRAEVERLTRWKSEATEVIVGLQDLGRALELPLGERITGGAAAEAARTLKAEVERLREVLADVEPEAFARGVAWAEGDDGETPAALLARATAAESALTEARAEIKHYRQHSDDWYEAFKQANASSWEYYDRAQSAEAALVSEREAHAGLRARLEAVESQEGLAEVIALIWREHSNCNWRSTGVNVMWSCGIWHEGPIHMQPTTRDRHVAALVMTQVRADRALAAEPAVAAEEGGEQAVGEAVHKTMWGVEVNGLAYGVSPNTRERAEQVATEAGVMVREVRECSWAGVTCSTPRPAPSGSDDTKDGAS